MLLGKIKRKLITNMSHSRHTLPHSKSCLHYQHLIKMSFIVQLLLLVINILRLFSLIKQR